MHRSRSAIKKINKTYSFGQKVLMKHAWRDCIHAKSFCRGLIVYHHSIFILFVLELLLVLFSNIWPVLMPVIAWSTFVFFVGFVIPTCVLNFVLDRYPFAKLKHEFRFRKYHNTSNHDSLWWTVFRFTFRQPNSNLSNCYAPHQSLLLMREVDSLQGEDGGREYYPSVSLLGWQLAAASPVGGSDSPPDCHSLPPTALRLPLTRGALGASAPVR